MCILKQSIPPYNQEPFHFVETGINVYSFEELLFHCYHYWKESVNDFLDGRISYWVKGTLKLNFIAGQIEKILIADEFLSEKYLKFLSIEGYFDEEDLQTLEYQVMSWESKSELDKLKQQGDERLNAEDYEKAVLYYNKLLSYGENAVIYNNIGCCYMKMGKPAEAEKHFILAQEHDPFNYKIKLNIAMLYLFENKSLAAEEMLLSLQKTDDCREVQYYLGELELRRNNLKKAEGYFSRSADMGNVLDANAALCKIEIKRKNFEDAAKYLEKMQDKTSWQYLYNMAQLSYQSGAVTKALIYAEKLLTKNLNKVSYWTFAAKLYRETGNILKAQEAVSKALDLDSMNEEAIFENARIKKAIGKPLEYQNLLKQIIEKWKNNYKAASTDVV